MRIAVRHAAGLTLSVLALLLVPVMGAPARATPPDLAGSLALPDLTPQGTWSLSDVLHADVTATRADGLVGLPVGAVFRVDGAEVLRQTVGSGTTGVELHVPELSLGVHTVSVDLLTTEGFEAHATADLTLVKGTVTFALTSPKALHADMDLPWVEWVPSAPWSGLQGEVVLTSGQTVLARQPATVRRFVLPELPRGSYDLTWSYSGDAHFLPATRTQHVDVAGWSTVPVIVSDHSTDVFNGRPPTPTRPGEPFTVTADVRAVVTHWPEDLGYLKPHPDEVGTFLFRDRDQVIGTAPAVAGHASLVLRDLLLGYHLITAEYSGSAHFEPGVSGSVTAQVSLGTRRDSVPHGSLDDVRSAPGAIDLSGWAVMDDSSSPIGVHVYVDGRPTVLTADGNRPDLAATMPGYGPRHGFNAHLYVPAGTHSVCAYAINSYSYLPNLTLGCRTVTVSGAPVGAVDAAVPAYSNGITVRGWALDPDTADPIAVHVYVDGRPTAVTADGERPDLATAFPGRGTRHGWSSTVSTPSGPHTVCAYAVDPAPGQPATALGCRTVLVPSGAPVGAVERADPAGPGALRVSGWALDPDTHESIQVHVYVDGRPTVLTADVDRSDLAAAFPGFGSRHGWAATLSAPPGPHTVCAYGIDWSPSYPASTLGCRTVTVPGQPIGAVDVVAPAGPGALLVSGWALDPDTADPVAVHVYVDGRGVPLRADVSRPDLAALFPGFGPLHGFGATLAVPAGSHQVCAYALDVRAGQPTTTLGCRSVTSS